MKTFSGILTTACVAALVLSGCDAATSEHVLGPAASVVAQTTGSSNAAIASTRSLKAANRAGALIYPSTGGTIAVGGHTLKIPAGAVTHPTWFSMQVIEANVVHVRLQAWRALDGAPVTQFPHVPIELKLDASDVDKLDLAGLVIVYLAEGSYSGAKEPVYTTVDGNSATLTGYLTHFSHYAIAREYSPGID